MSVPPRSRFLALLLSAVPGWGHIYWRREALGFSIFTAFATAGFGLLNGLFIYIGSGRGAVIGISTALLFATAIPAWAHILRATSPRRVKASEERREKTLHEGMIAYLRGDLPGARAGFRACVEADPADFEALFRLGVVASRLGDVRSARTFLRRARKHDLGEKWRWEISRELDRLQVAAAAARTGRPGQEKAAQKTAV